MSFEINISEIRSQLIRFRDYHKEIFLDLAKDNEKIQHVAWGIFYGISSFVLGVGCCFLASRKAVVMSAFFPNKAELNIPIENQSLLVRKCLYFPLKLTIGCLACVVGPILEEIHFRKMIAEDGINKIIKFSPKLKSVEKTVTMKIARIGISTFLFSLAHLSDFWFMDKKNMWTKVIYTLSSGLIYGIAKEHKGLCSSIVAHGTANVISMVIREKVIFSHLFSQPSKK